jgi:hypothetical protein
MKIIQEHGGYIPGYRPTNLFPEASGLKQIPLRDYVERRLVELARNKEISVANLCNQPTYLVDTVGMVLYGEYFEQGGLIPTKRSGKPVPEELSNYEVKVRSINSDKMPTIRFMKDKFVPQHEGHYLDRENIPPPPITTWVDMEAPEAVLKLPDAWKILRRHGKHCATAKSKKLQDRKWLVEEVIEETRVDETPKRGRPPRVN